MHGKIQGKIEWRNSGNKSDRKVSDESFFVFPGDCPVKAHVFPGNSPAFFCCNRKRLYGTVNFSEGITDRFS